MRRVRTPFSLLLVLAAVALVVMPVSAQVTPTVTVEDQSIEGGSVTVASVVSDGPGWVVIHRQEGDTFGAHIGFAPVQAGENTNVVVEVDVTQATETLYAVLHADTGVEGEFEFPGGDPPVTVEGQIVASPFQVTGGLEAQQEPTATSTAEAEAETTATPEAEAEAETTTTPEAETETTATPEVEAEAETTATLEAEAEATATPAPAATATPAPAPVLPTAGGGPSSVSWATLALVLGGLILLGGVGLSLATQRIRNR